MLDADTDAVAELMTTEMGKTLASAKAEVGKCADGAALLRRPRPGLPGAASPATPTPSAPREAYVVYQPIGVVLAIMPWNFPLWQAMRFAAPALMAGNVGLLKHASNVPQTALYMEELFGKAGFPDRRLPDAADRLGRRSSRCCATTGWPPRRSPAARRPGSRWPRSPATR